MLTAEIKINNEVVGTIEAQNVKTISDKPGDFLGDRATVCEYKCIVNSNLNGKFGPNRKEFTVIHDRRFGWEGLLNKIADAVIPTVVETMCEDDIVGICRNCGKRDSDECPIYEMRGNHNE